MPTCLAQFVVAEPFTNTEYATPSIVQAQLELLRQAMAASGALCFAFVCGSSAPVLAPYDACELLDSFDPNEAAMGLICDDDDAALREEFLIALKAVGREAAPLWSSAFDLLGPYVFKACSQFCLLSRRMAADACSLWPNTKQNIADFAAEYAQIVAAMCADQTSDSRYACRSVDEMVFVPWCLAFEALRIKGLRPMGTPVNPEWIEGWLEMWKEPSMAVKMKRCRETSNLVPSRLGGNQRAWWRADVLSTHEALKFVDGLPSSCLFVRKVAAWEHGLLCLTEAGLGRAAAKPAASKTAAMAAEAEAQALEAEAKAMAAALAPALADQRSKAVSSETAEFVDSTASAAAVVDAGVAARYFFSDGTSTTATVCNVDSDAETFDLSWRRQNGTVEQMTVNLLQIPSLGLALQSVWKEAAENGTKPGCGEYRNHRWEDRQKSKGRPVDECNERRMALVYVVESRDPASSPEYTKDVLAPLEKMVQDPALKGAVGPVLDWAKKRVATCGDVKSRERRFIPPNKVVSIYIVGASKTLEPGMPFYGVSNFQQKWPLLVTLPLGVDAEGELIDLKKDIGFSSHLQGVPVEPFCYGGTAKTMRAKVLVRLSQALSATAAAEGASGAAATPSGSPSKTAPVLPDAPSKTTSVLELPDAPIVHVYAGQKHGGRLAELVWWAWMSPARGAFADEWVSLGERETMASHLGVIVTYIDQGGRWCAWTVATESAIDPGNWGYFPARTLRNAESAGALHAAFCRPGGPHNAQAPAPRGGRSANAELLHSGFLHVKPFVVIQALRPDTPLRRRVHFEILREHNGEPSFWCKEAGTQPPVPCLKRPDTQPPAASGKRPKVTFQSPFSPRSKHFSSYKQEPDEQPSFYERDARRGFEAPLSKFPSADEARRATARKENANRRAMGQEQQACEHRLAGKRTRSCTPPPPGAPTLTLTLTLTPAY